MVIQIGVEKVIDGRWTCIFEIHKDKAHILFYGRNCYSGYDDEVPNVKLIEGDGRIIQGLNYEGKTYEVKNKLHIFDYGASNN